MLELLKRVLEGVVVTEVSADEDDGKTRVVIETKENKIALYLDKNLKDSVFVVAQEEGND